MAPKLTKSQKDELASFLDQLYKDAGYTTQKQWAVEADYHETNLSTAMNRAVLDGVSGYSLLKLIRAAALRIGETEEEAGTRLARETAGGEEKVLVRLRGLEAKVDVQGEATTEILAGLVDDVSRILQRLDTVGGQATGTGAL